MPSNSAEIIQEIRTEFEMLIEFVSGEQVRTATADHIERSLFKLLLELGGKLLLLFFVTRSQLCSRESYGLAEGRELAYHSDKKRSYFSVFGKLPLWRPYFYEPGEGVCPLDSDLSLGEDCYSDLLRELGQHLGIYSVYGKGCEILERFLGVKLSTSVLQQVIAADAAEVEAYYAQKPAPTPETEAEILVVQADGKGVPIVLEPSVKSPVRLGKGEKRGRKKEAIVTALYTIASQPRSPEQVIRSFFCQQPQSLVAPKKSERPTPKNKQIWATLAGKQSALARLKQQVSARQAAHIQHKVALCDGCEALQTPLQTLFPDFELILDFVHANEYLWKVANALLGETNDQRLQWVTHYTLRMLSGETRQIVADFRQLALQPLYSATQRQALCKTANYFERNLPFMDYPTYLAKGWPIASGVIEGACRHFVKDRFELSGMRWTLEGAENLLRLRAIAENGDWETYHTFRKLKRHQRLYSSSAPEAQPLELQVLEADPLMALPFPIHPVSAPTSSPTSHFYHSYQSLPSYQELPLVV